MHRPVRLGAATCLALAVAVTVGVIVATAGSRPSDAGGARRCSLGKLVAQRTLLRPTAGTPYSVDVLNPDVVHWHGRYLMYVSGNDVASTASTNSQWSTELAVADNPLGPFHMTSFHAHYLNGGTTVWRGKLWHAVEVNQGYTTSIAYSSDGIHWHQVAWLPTWTYHGRPVGGADPALLVVGHKLEILMFMVYHPLAASQILASVMFNGTTFSDFRPILSIAPPDGLGEPYEFKLRGQQALVYTWTDAHNVRSIGLAIERDGRFQACRQPVIRGGAPWARKIAIDPSVLTVGPDLYVYYGGGSVAGLGSDVHGAIGVAEYRP